MCVFDSCVFWTETLKILGAGFVAFLIGLIAKKQDWFRESLRDESRIRYEHFKAERQRRLEVLADMATCVRTLAGASDVVWNANYISTQLGMQDPRYAAEIERLQSNLAVVREQIRKLHQLSGRFDPAPTIPTPLQSFLSGWTRELEVLLGRIDPAGKDEERTEIRQLCSTKEHEIVLLIQAERQRLLDGKPDPNLEVY